MILLSSARMNHITIIFVCGFCGTSFQLYSLHFCVKQKWIAASWNGNFPFCRIRRLRPGLYLLVFLELVCCSLLVIAKIMEDALAPKRFRRAISSVCEACGKHFDTSFGFDQHRTSGYPVDTPCHVLDDGSARAQLVPVWWPHRGRQCQQPCCKSWNSLDEHMVQFLKQAKHIPDYACLE